MTLTTTIDGDTFGTIRHGSLDLGENAENGSVGEGQFVIDDVAGNIVTTGWKDLSVTEDDCEDPLIQSGFVGRRVIGRPPAKIAAQRQITLSTKDLNDLLNRKVIRSGGKRPRETIGERITWLLGSDYLSGFVADNGFVHYPDTVMDKNDYRTSKPGDVLGDCATRVNFNFFVYPDPTTSEPSLWFENSNTSTDYSSEIRISNVLSDVDWTTTFPASPGATLDIDPDSVYSAVVESYKNGRVYRERAATATDFAVREGVAPSSTVKRRARAISQANRYLQLHKSEQHIIEDTVLVTSSRVGKLKAGMRVQARYSTMVPEGYGEFTWLRVLSVKVKGIFSPKGIPDAPNEPLYTLSVRMSPQEVEECIGAEGVELVQFAMANHPSDTEITLPDPPTVGNTMILAVGHRDELALGPLPENIAGWTRVPIGAGPLTFPYALDDTASGLSHCDLWYRPVQSGDTGVETLSDCMKILSEFTGILDPISGARAETSDQNDSTVSITSGDPGGDALVIAAVITRQDDTGRITEAVGTNKMPTGGSAAPPSSTGVGHTCLYLMWGVSTGSAVTLSGEMSGANQDAGPQWGARLAAFEACS